MSFVVSRTWSEAWKNLTVLLRKRLFALGVGTLDKMTFARVKQWFNLLLSGRSLRAV